MPLPAGDNPMLATVLITVVALIHLYILVLEMFLWNTKTGHKAFDLFGAATASRKILYVQAIPALAALLALLI